MRIVRRADDHGIDAAVGKHGINGGAFFAAVVLRRALSAAAHGVKNGCEHALFAFPDRFRMFLERFAASDDAIGNLQ